MSMHPSAKDDFSSNARKMRKLHLVREKGQPLRPLTDAKGLRQYKVSAVGQMTLPASARQRWALKNGGRVAVADLGYAILVLPEHGWQEVVDKWIPRDAIKSAVAAHSQSDKLE